MRITLILLILSSTVAFGLSAIEFNDRGVALARNGKTEYAIEILGYASSFDPDNSAILVNLGYAYTDNGEFERAHYYFTAAKNLAPDTVEPYLALAALEIIEGFPASAIKYIDQVFIIDPENALAYFTLGDVMYDLSFTEIAYEYYLKAAGYEPYIDKSHLNAARAAMILGDSDAALECFDEYAKHSLTPEFGYCNKGHLQFMTEDYPGAIESYMQALTSIVEEDIEIATIANIALAKSYIGDETAKDWFDDAAFQHPSDGAIAARVYNNYASYKWRTGSVDQARILMEAAYCTGYADVSTLGNYGSVLAKLGQYDIAIYYLNLAIAESNFPLLPLCIKAVALGELGKNEEAVALFDEVISMHPGYPTAYNNRAVFHYKRGLYKEALEDLVKALSFVNDSDEREIIENNIMKTEIMISDDAETYSVESTQLPTKTEISDVQYIFPFYDSVIITENQTPAPDFRYQILGN